VLFGFNIMKAIFESDDQTEIKRLAKSTDMALCLWEIVHNGWREFKHSDYDYKKAWDKIRDIISEHNIDIDDLIE
jgi:hypothetical protein